MGNILYSYPKVFTKEMKDVFNLNTVPLCSTNETLIKENLTKYVTAVLNELHLQNETTEVDPERRNWLTNTLYNTGSELLYTDNGTFTRDDLQTNLDTPGTLFGASVDRTVHWYTYTGKDVKLYNPQVDPIKSVTDLVKKIDTKVKKTPKATKKADPVKKTTAVDTKKTTVDTKPVVKKPARVKPVRGKQYDNAMVTVEFNEYSTTGVIETITGVGYDVTLKRVPCLGYDAFVIASINKRNDISTIAAADK